MSMKKHQQQQQDQDQEFPMDSHKNPNLETTHNHHHHHVLPSPPSSSSQEFNTMTHHQHNISKKTHQDGNFIFKNADEVIKNPTLLSSSSPAAGERHAMPPPPPPPQDFNMTLHQHNIPKKTHEDGNFIFKNAYEVIKNPTLLSSSSPAAGEGHAIPPPPPPPQDFNVTRHQHNISKKTHEDEKYTFKNAYEVIKNPTFLSSSSPSAGERHVMPPPPPPPQDLKETNLHASRNPNSEMMKEPNSLSCLVEESGRDRLARHRVEMAGRVRIPDIWGHEDLLKDWIDCTVFDSSLGNNSIMSARAALVQERRSTLRIQNQC